MTEIQKMALIVLFGLWLFALALADKLLEMLTYG
jgi:hypothetical protein